ncbi:YqcC family protein [Shewanella glacialipiscicola]|nr:YqcC family protein [Shewanella glacialipiscicola]MCL1084896.1 YqcC family protein [Shewanella glacialipiscicola]MCU7995032.1 YqcC family protein [Shewanella glacialipiscicola]MCU8026440.1 YqcC family protein [Shewanella glacialipiscicola]
MLYGQTQVKLDQIAQALKEAELWSELAPSADAMASTAPFACDLMPLEQWLQFVLLPRMRNLIDTAAPLPTQIAIAPMAEHVWQNMPLRQNLIGVLNELDMLLNESR